MTPVATATDGRIDVEGKRIELHNVDKVFWPQLGLTKADLIDYYLEVSPHLLPHLKGRPFIMRPFPNGAGGRSYYRWQIPSHAPSWVHRWKYQARTEERLIEMVVVDSLPDLIWVANQACIEMHPWLSRTDDPTHPDLVLFDLDPGPGVDFPATLEIGAWLHETLEGLGLRSYAKTSGRDGLHVMLPVERRYAFGEVRSWVRSLARRLEAAHPGRVTVDKALARRRGRVLVDYGQNGLGKSIASAYSARATPMATVSAPLTWQEVAAGRVRQGDLTVLTVPQRLKETGDLLAPLLEGQELPAMEG